MISARIPASSDVGAYVPMGTSNQLVCYDLIGKCAEDGDGEDLMLP